MNAQHRQTIGRGRGRRFGRSAAIALGMLAFGLVLHAVPVAADSWTTTAATCTTKPAVTYTVPASTRYAQVVAIGGTGFGGATATDTNTGGAGGTGAKVTAYVPVTPGQQLKVGVGRNGYLDDAYSGRPNGGLAEYGIWHPSAGQGGGSSVVTTAAGDPCLGCATADTLYQVCFRSSQDAARAAADTTAMRAEILVLAGGGGGGGGASGVGSGGKGGNAGANADGSGQFGAKAYGLDSDCGNGGGGGSGTATAVGAGGTRGCEGGYTGSPGEGFFGGESHNSGDDPGLGGGGNGGGGYYGGGAGGSGFVLGGGGGGAGSSHIGNSARGVSIAQDTSATPSVTITPIQTPTTTATLSGTTSGNNWYTSAVTVTLTATKGTLALGKTYYALNNPACSATNATTLAACTEYTAPLTISSGVHTLTYFSADAVGLDEAVQTKSFAVTVTTAAVSGASIGSGTNPTAISTTSGGSVTVSGSGSGVVGTAVYGANPAGAPVFNSSGAYIDVLVAGSGLTSLTITDCNLNSGTNVYWWNGTAWALASNQTYNATTHCVTVTVTGSTVPNLSQLTGTVWAAGSPPTTTAVATTADGMPYTAGTWTKQSVTVTFTCSANATPTAPVMRAEGSDQSASGTCTDGLQQKTTTTFTGINVDKTLPTCSVQVSPTVLWSPDGKPVAVTGTATVGDNRSGIASVVGGAVTSNEALAPTDVQGFTINTPVTTPLTLSTVVNITGQLKATRTPAGSGRTYTQTVTVTDQAGNTNTTPCTWTVSVPRDQAPGR